VSTERIDLITQSLHKLRKEVIAGDGVKKVIDDENLVTSRGW
jgi:hypothetical protein